MSEPALLKPETATLGRPSTYTPERGVAICRALEAGLTVRQMRRINRRRPGTWVDPDTVYEWEKAHPEFAERLARARRAQASDYAHGATEAVDAPLDLRLGGKIASAGVTRQANRATHRRWLAGCLDPGTYGERLKVDAQVAVAVVSVDWRALLNAPPAAPK